MSQMKPRRLCRSCVIRSKCAAFSASVMRFFLDAGDTLDRSRARPGSSRRTRWRGPVAGQPSPAPEVAKLAIAQPPGPFTRPAPHVAVGGEVKASHGLVGDAVVAIEALPPLLAVGDVDAAVGRDPDLPDAVGGDRHDAGTRLDSGLAGLELPGADLERLVAVARRAKSPAIGHDPDAAAGRPGRRQDFRARGQLVDGDEVVARRRPRSRREAGRRPRSASPRAGDRFLGRVCIAEKAMTIVAKRRVAWGGLSGGMNGSRGI